MNRRLIILLLLLLVTVIAAAGGWWWWNDRVQRSFYTDGDHIRASVRDAWIRQILWQDPVPLSETLRSDNHEVESCLSADGALLLFVREGPGDDADIWFSTRDIAQPGGWSRPAPLLEVNTDHHERSPALSPDGKTLLFASDRPGGKGGSDLWMMRRGDFGWIDPVNLGEELNSEFDERDPCFSPDGSRLVFASSRPVSAAASALSSESREESPTFDLYTATIRPDGFERASILGLLSSHDDDRSPSFSPAGDFLYFSSNRVDGFGGYDLYRARRLGDGFTDVESLGDAINTAANEIDPSPDAGGFALIFSSDRAKPGEAVIHGRAFRADLWRAESREVFVRIGPRDPIDFASLGAWLAPLLLWLVLLLGALGAMIVTWKGVRSRRISLLARCLLASILAHMLLMVLLTFWQVTTTIAEMVERGSATRVVISGAAPSGGGLAGQLRGGVSGDLNVAPTEVAASDRALRTMRSPGVAAELVNLQTGRAAPGSEQATDVETVARESDANRAQAPETDQQTLMVAQQMSNQSVAAPQTGAPIIVSEQSAQATAGAASPVAARAGKELDVTDSGSSAATIDPVQRQAPVVETVTVASSTGDFRGDISQTPAADSLPGGVQNAGVESMSLRAADVSAPEVDGSMILVSGESSGPSGPTDAGAGAQRRASDVGASQAARSSDGAGAAIVLAPTSLQPGESEAEASGNVGVAPAEASVAAGPQLARPLAIGESARDIGEAPSAQTSGVAAPAPGTMIASGNDSAEQSVQISGIGPGAARTRSAGQNASVEAATSSVEGDELVRSSVTASDGALEVVGGAGIESAREAQPGGVAGGSAPAISSTSLTGTLDSEGGDSASSLATPGEVMAAVGNGTNQEQGAVVSAASHGGQATASRAGTTIVPSQVGNEGGAAILNAQVGISSGEVGVIATSNNVVARDAQDIGDGTRSVAAPTSTLALEDTRSGTGTAASTMALPGEGVEVAQSGDESVGEGRELSEPRSALVGDVSARRDGAAGGGASSGVSALVSLAPVGAGAGDSEYAPASGVSTATAIDAPNTGSAAAAPDSAVSLALDDVGSLPAAVTASLGLPGDGVEQNAEQSRGATGDSLIQSGIAARSSASGRSADGVPASILGHPGATTISLNPNSLHGRGSGGVEKIDASIAGVTGVTADAGLISGSTNAPLAASLGDITLPDVSPGVDMTLRLPTDVSAPANPYAARAEDTRLEVVKRMGGSEETEAAVSRALEWFARHQSSDGRWAARAFDDECNECGGQGKFDTDIATTGLALLCFLGADHTHVKEGRYSENVRRGLQWLVSQQQADGDLRGGETMYSHGIATIALAEAMGMTRDLQLEDPVRRAVEFIHLALNRNEGGWRYEPRQAGDTSVAGWQVMALMSAKRAGLSVPDDVFAAASAWMDRVSTPNRPGHYAYQPGQPPSPSMTAEGLFIQQLLGVPRDDPRMSGSVEMIMQNLPRWDEAASTYYWYYATLAMFQHQGPDWERWNRELTRVLLASQRKSGEASGSWDIKDNWSQIGGRVYQTALCTLCLEVYYRYLPMYRAPTLAGVTSSVRGTVTDASTGKPLAGAIVKLDMSIGAGVLIAATDADGRYALALPELPADFVALSAAREGYVPAAINISREEARQAGVTRDFALEPKRSSVIALEDDPEVHHLGNDEFEGAINSQFQKQAQGNTYRDTFALTRQHLPPAVRRAELVLMVKGAQAQNSIFINDQRIRTRLSRSPRDGSFGEFRVDIPLEWLREGENTISIRSSTSEGDLDDFEFVNVQIQFDAPEQSAND